MSQPPSKPHGKPGPGGGWSGRPGGVPGHFRSPSPYSPTGSPHPQRARGPSTPVHHAHPTSPLTYSGMMHPMSPVPIGMPISPGISPVFGSPSGYIQCPRPRWPSPMPMTSQTPRPYIPTQSSAESGASSPLACGPPEYMIGTYRSGDYEYVGVPLEHSQTEEEASGPSTAEIIANQSQDYVDEKLAEYQATIQQLQRVASCSTNLGYSTDLIRAAATVHKHSKVSAFTTKLQFAKPGHCSPENIPRIFGAIQHYHKTPRILKNIGITLSFAGYQNPTHQNLLGPTFSKSSTSTSITLKPSQIEEASTHQKPSGSPTKLCAQMNHQFKQFTAEVTFNQPKEDTRTTSSIQDARLFLPPTLPNS
ncbi:hypothetical protein WN55_01592 [Dufourea novaeangliae]|uniref:Uncharacterized protein n=1 Tax=Dufourea novaeangliae TaxID=178035 RepID=A0A154PGC0_DUFNO|nr:hypothetical protein WN55_01592 [Dufourea novaeangliae]